ncbi:MAG: hypothetical protein ACOYMY_01910 [Prochlorococcaceae cyanobacterium]|jgi:hypothetical protein
MVFQKLFGGERKPFLELSDAGGDRPVTTVAPAPKPVAATPVPAAPAPAVAAAAAPLSPAAPAGQPSITTAEALAAERAAAQKAETPRELTTFAAELLNPAQAIPRGRRRPGASLAPFRDLASSLRGSR